MLGVIQALCNAVGGRRVSDFPEKNRYEDVYGSTLLALRQGGWVKKGVTLHLNGSLRTCEGKGREGKGREGGNVLRRMSEVLVSGERWRDRH